MIAAPALALLLAGPPPASEPALALLPEELRRGLSVVAGARACPAGEPEAGAVVDAAAGRIELCAGGEEARRRQILFGALLIADARAGWSREGRWRRYNGWSWSVTGGWQARNEDPGAHAAAAGRLSPAHDLASFGARWIAERHARAADADGALECRLLPQAVFLHQRLRGLSLPAALQAAPRCRAFEAWARRERLAGMEIGLAMPSTNSLASMFGHVFLRLVDSDEPDEPAALEDRTLAFLVDNPLPIEEEPLYALKGIGGAYRATLVERSFLDTYRTYVVGEGRDLRRYRLHLSAEETEALLQRLWSLRQAGSYRYFFFGRNCATSMVDLVNSVLPDDRQVQVPLALATTPAGTLEGYAGARGGDGRPLLTFIPETVLSYEHEARLAALERERIARRLRAAAGAPLPEAFWAVLRTGSPQARAAAYRALAAGPLAGRPETAALLRASATVEVHLSALANQAAEEALLRQRRGELRATLAQLRQRLQPRVDACAPGAALAELGDDAIAVRLRGYRGIAARLRGCDDSRGDDLRRLALLESEARHDDGALDPALRDALFFPQPDRTLGEQRFAAGLAPLIDRPIVTVVSEPLLAIQQAQAAVRAPPPGRVHQDEAAARRQEELRLHDRAVARTGIDELELGVGLDRGARGLLLLGGAMHDERLGDQRRFGFPPHTALVVGRTFTALSLQGMRPALAAWQAQLLGYRALPPPGSAGRLGGEIYADLGGHPRASRTAEARVGGGWLLPLFASGDLASHLIASGGPLGTFDRAGGASRWGVGASLGLEARRALDPANQAAWVSARACLRALATTAGGRVELVGGAELRLPVRARVRLPLSSGRGLGLRLSAAVFAPTVPGDVDGQLALTLALE